ncbi:MAG: APC family permease [Sphaerochaetaceae bacterium]
MNKEKNKMTLFSSIFMAIGSIIGASIFATTPIAIKIVGGNGIVWGFILASLFVFLKTWPEMVASSALPATGGAYMHLTRLIHPSVGILHSINYLVIGPMKIATMALTFSTYFAMLIPKAPPVLVAIIITLIFTVLSLYGVKISSWVQNVLVVVLLLAMFIYVFGGWGKTVITLGEVLSTTVKLSKLWAAMGIMHGSLIGANALMYVADEIENPGKTIPLAFIISTAFTGVLYAAIAYVTIGVMPEWFKIDNLATTAKIFMSPALLVFFISGGALLAVVTSINSAILMFSRSHFAGARDGLYPKVIMTVNKHGAPSNAIWLNSAIAILAMASGYDLTDVVNITSIPGLLLSPIILATIFFIPSKYPASYKTAFIKTPHWFNCTVVVVASVLSFILGSYVIGQMAAKNWITMIIFYIVALIYVLLRAKYLKKSGVDLLANMKKPYQPWVEQEAKAKEQLAN